MMNLKVLGIAAVAALVLPTASFAQHFGDKGGATARVGGGGFTAGARVGGAPTGSVATGNVRMGSNFSGGSNWSGNRTWSGNQTWSGGSGNWSGRNWHHRGGSGGFFPGVVAGAVVGGALASSAYYGSDYYYGPGYYDDSYAYYDAPVAVAPVGDDAVAYCMQTYRSYDPASGTYLGFDGLRHPCP